MARSTNVASAPDRRKGANRQRAESERAARRPARAIGAGCWAVVGEQRIGMTGNAGGRYAGGRYAGSQLRAADRAGATDSCGGGEGDGVRGGAYGAISRRG